MATATSNELITPTKYKVNVGGTDREYTIEELTTLASKAAGADEQFRSAAEIRKENERLKLENAQAAKTRAIFDKAKNGDPQAFLDYAGSLGLDPQQANYVWQQVMGTGTQEEEEERPVTRTKGQNVPQKLTLDQLPDEVIAALKVVGRMVQTTDDPASALQIASRATEQNAAERARKQIEQALDKHPKLRNIVSRNTASRKKLVGSVFSDLQSRVERGEAYDSALTAAIADKADLLVSIVQDAPVDELGFPGLFGMAAPNNGRSITLEAPQQPSVDEKTLHDKGSIARLADELVRYDQYQERHRGGDSFEE